MENRYQMALNIDMSARYHHLCEGFYQRVNDLGLFLNIVLGSAAVGGAVARAPEVAIAAGALVSIVSALNIVMGTLRKAQAHRDQYRRYTDLAGRQQGMSEADIASAVHAIERDDAPVIEAFRKRAYLDNLLRHGHEADAPALHFTLAERMRLALA